MAGHWLLNAEVQIQYQGCPHEIVVYKVVAGWDFLQTLQFVKTNQIMQELQQVVSDFYFKKMNEEADKWWEENNMTKEKFEEMFSYIHYRTPYK